MESSISEMTYNYTNFDFDKYTHCQFGLSVLLYSTKDKEKSSLNDF